MPDKLDKVKKGFETAREVSAIGKSIAPPQARPAMEAADQIIDIAGQSIGIVGRLRSLFRKRKK